MLNIEDVIQLDMNNLDSYSYEERKAERMRIEKMMTMIERLSFNNYLNNICDFGVTF